MSESAVTLYQKPQTAVEIRSQVNLIQEVMQGIMKKDTHYGTIPGCKKPSLYKAGSEVLLSTFRISIEPIVEDLSTDDIARYRVITRATSMVTGAYLGSGVGEASSAEEKYFWREAVCVDEFDATPENRRRLKYKKGYNGGKVFTVQQVRTEKADVANTILKMAKKRSQMDVTLTVTAASDVFAQDLEDLPEEMRGDMDDFNQEPAKQELPTEIQRRAPVDAVSHTTVPEPLQPRTYSGTPAQTRQGVHTPAPATNRPVQAPQQGNVRVISEAQARRFYSIWKQAGKSKEDVTEYLRSNLGITDDRQMPLSAYDSACSWAQGA